MTQEQSGVRAGIWLVGSVLVFGWGALLIHWLSHTGPHSLGILIIAGLCVLSGFSLWMLGVASRQPGEPNALSFAFLASFLAGMGVMFVTLLLQGR